MAMRYAGQDIISLISVTCHIVLYSCKHNVQRHAYIHVQLFEFDCLCSCPTVGLQVVVTGDVRWPRGIMGFTRAFRNLQRKFSTAITTFNFQPRFNFSLFQLPQRNRYFQRSTAVATFNRDSVYQRSAAIPTFNRDSVFQRSSAIPTFNHDSVFQL